MLKSDIVFKVIGPGSGFNDIPMKTILLAGGLGTRLAEETTLIPKPMVEIGGKPILWHIMNIYAAQGFGNSWLLSVINRK